MRQAFGPVIKVSTAWGTAVQLVKLPPATPALHIEAKFQSWMFLAWRNSQITCLKRGPALTQVLGALSAMGGDLGSRLLVGATFPTIMTISGTGSTNENSFSTFQINKQHKNWPMFHFMPPALTPGFSFLTRIFWKATVTAEVRPPSCYPCQIPWFCQWLFFGAVAYLCPFFGNCGVGQQMGICLTTSFSQMSQQKFQKTTRSENLQGYGEAVPSPQQHQMVLNSLGHLVCELLIMETKFYKI